MTDQRVILMENHHHESGQPTAKHCEEGDHPILAASSSADERRRVLKHGDTFAVFLISTATSSRAERRGRLP